MTRPLQVDTKLLDTDLQLTMAYFVLLLISWWEIKEICPGLTSGYPFGIFKLFFEHQQLMAQENFGKIPEAKSG